MHVLRSPGCTVPQESMTYEETDRAMTDSVLSYWSDYFSPDHQAQFADHSTGLIASRLYSLLSALGPVSYFDNAKRPRGMSANLFVGHFWSFESMCRANEFDKKVAVYVLSDPSAARERLAEAATRYAVPMPTWDLPPAEFDHDATMELADLVLLCGNQHTLDTFPERWRDKIRLFNYSLDEEKWPQTPSTWRPSADFVYVVSDCGLRKGFLDVINTWSTISPDVARLHVVGRLDSPYDRLLAEANTGSVIVHGWIDSSSKEYRDVLRFCRFAYIPTWIEGQMGTMLEVLFAGCVPVTTRASGVDDEVLDQCLIVDPMRPDQHRSVIEDVVHWSFEEWARRSDELQRTARRRHSWASFDYDVGGALADLLQEERSHESQAIR
jgi:glycosyltransferase involved in cell wall biosynthesis